MATRCSATTDSATIPAALEAFVRETNPWWQGEPGLATPAFRRWAFPLLPLGVLVTLGEDVKLDDPRIVPIALRSLLLLR